jgi:hypothetical protein
MTDDGLADLTMQYVSPFASYLLIKYWKGDYPSWRKMGYALKRVKTRS